MYNHEYDDFDIIELADDFYLKDKYPLEFDNSRLSKATDVELFSALYEWFHARYCDPSENTIYITREGGYQWIHGGPYNAYQELEERFADIVPSQIIEKVAYFICKSKEIDQWAPIDWNHGDEDFFEIPIGEQSDIFSNLKNNISKLLELNELNGEASAIQTSHNLLFAALITALEVYLYETANFWINCDEELFRNLVTRFEQIKNKKVKYEEIFRVMGQLKKEMKSMLQKTVWHNNRDVKKIYKAIFNIDIDLNDFREEILKRNHIVHRVSKDFRGNDVLISKSDIEELTNKIVSFAEKVESNLIPFQVRL